jgi:hypothetical protein
MKSRYDNVRCLATGGRFKHCRSALAQLIYRVVLEIIDITMSFNSLESVAKQLFVL